LIEFNPDSPGTDIAGVLKFITNAIKKRCTAFLLSDFLDQDAENNKLNYEEALRIANNKHDLIGLQIYDKRETELPPVGIINVQDAETGETLWVDSSNSSVRNAYKHWWNNTNNLIKTTFSQAGVDYETIATNQDYVKPLVNLFKRR
ncbi:MAG: DUF58 domain-containing protein, partial [Bacteroidales bacterium]